MEPMEVDRMMALVEVRPREGWMIIAPRFDPETGAQVSPPGHARFFYVPEPLPSFAHGIQFAQAVAFISMNQWRKFTRLHLELVKGVREENALRALRDFLLEWKEDEE